MTDPQFEHLLARSLREDSQRGASPEAIARILATGHEYLARIAAGRTPAAWFARLLDAAAEVVQGSLAHEQLAGAAAGLRSGATVRQRVFGADGSAAQLDLESSEDGDGTCRVRGWRSGPSGASRVLVLEEGSSEPREVPCTEDGRFEFTTASGRVDLATSMGSSVLVVDGVDLP
jgi:hypothetical protein